MTLPKDTVEVPIKWLEKLIELSQNKIVGIDLSTADAILLTQLQMYILSAKELFKIGGEDGN